MPTQKDSLPTLHFATQTAWEDWLETNHTTCTGLWLKLAKKSAGIASVSYAEALDIALCYGWIDGQKASLDELFWLQRFTPRQPRSKWSQVNCKKAEELIAQGRMRAAGLKQVEAAKADGRWENAYHSQSKMAVPEDLLKRLAESPRARAFFETLNSTNRYAILYRIHDAKKPETRARRIEKFVTMLEEGRGIYE